jgi:hypothetical protein
MAEHGAGADRGREPPQADAEAYGVQPAELQAWHPLSAFEVHLSRDADPDRVLSWVRDGAMVTVALEAQRLGLTRHSVQPWLDEGFCLADAVDAYRNGIPLAVARSWRAAGFIFPDAAVLLEDGWTLQAATAARYADLARNPHPPDRAPPPG